MRINSVAAALGAAMLAGKAYAEDVQDDSAATSSSSAIELPTFTPTTIKAEFLEQFTDDWEERWKPSHAKKDMKSSGKEDEEWAYVGEWSVEEPTVLKGIEGDKGLVVKNRAAHHAISAKFPKKIDNTDKTLVVQYEVKLQNGLECGGAYLKLLRDTKALHQDEFANTTPYVIMFGPDKCGATNKVHFIFNHKNPKTGEYEEKHMNSPPAAHIVQATELYTLIVHPNNTYLMLQNGEIVKEGSLLEDFTPAVNPPKEIDDAEDTKPEDWVEESRIADPEAQKPEDWDEDAPFEIFDEEATQPEDWLEEEPLTIADPEAQKPADWEDDEDGDWLAPTVPNPKCADVSGCGPWTKPMMKNPDYKGKWTAPFIDNPAYKGEWAPRKIENPDFFEDKTPANFEPMGAIGFEIWTMQNDILFDNIYIGHSVEDARKLAEETFFVKHTVEDAIQQAEQPKAEKKENLSASSVKFLDDPVRYVKEKLNKFIVLASEDPIDAIKNVPEIPGSIAAVFLLLLSGVFILGGAAPAAPVGKSAVTQSKTEDKPQAVVASSTDTGKEGTATKRTARSQQ
ncbi:hypothetical protein SEPCBS57363_000374 [Sporothrix epigloea]|uniref:Calnexin n=1 Tax=Sporothrix epigloea TaxID=1892477 RepID=A0ABP0D805_9PEZI